MLLSAQHVEHEGHPKEPFDRHHKSPSAEARRGWGRLSSGEIVGRAFGTTAHGCLSRCGHATVPLQCHPRQISFPANTVATQNDAKYLEKLSLG